tara:strand:- start:1306 stop:1581 length:276 start_codon:yes stop_codon:yes gene_type:complete
MIMLRKENGMAILLSAVAWSTLSFSGETSLPVTLISDLQYTAVTKKHRVNNQLAINTVKRPLPSANVSKTHPHQRFLLHSVLPNKNFDSKK